MLLSQDRGPLAEWQDDPAPSPARSGMCGYLHSPSRKKWRIYDRQAFLIVNEYGDMMSGTPSIDCLDVMGRAKLDVLFHAVSFVMEFGVL